MRAGALELTWQGERGQTLRAILGVSGGQPVVRELAVRRNGEWSVLGRDLTPEYQVTTGRRRISAQQEVPLRQLGMFTPEIIERQKWFAFWDAPLNVPGRPGSNAAVDLPRKPEEIQRAWATFQITGCQVVTDGTRLEANFPGVSLGIFSGGLRYTVYRGTNLIRQEVIAKTDAPSVAYKFVAGLKGFTIGNDTRLMWRDIARGWQHNLFGGHVNSDPVALKARNRLAIVESGAGTVAVFPASHQFFFSREVEANLGYNYYRKDSETTFAVGVRQADREESFRPYGTTDAVWQRRVTQAREFEENFALYNAPPGTMQRMAVYFYLDSGNAQATQRAVMAFTHDDVYKPLPGYQVMVSHFHFHLNEELTDHDLVAGQGFVDVVVGEGHHCLIGGLRVARIQVKVDGHPLHSARGRVVEREVLLELARLGDAALPDGVGLTVRLEGFLAIGLAHSHGEIGFAVLAVVVIAEVGFHFARKEEFVGCGKGGHRAGAAFHNHHAAARLQRHGVAVDVAAKKVVLPAAGDIAPHQAGIVADGEPFQPGDELISHGGSVGLGNHLLAKQVGAAVNGVAQAAREEAERDAGEVGFQAAAIGIDLAAGDLKRSPGALDLFGFAGQIDGRVGTGAPGDVQRGVPERKPFLTLDDFGREHAQLTQWYLLLGGDAPPAGGHLVFGGEVASQHGPFPVSPYGQFSHHGLAAADPQDCAQCLAALALPGQFQSTRAHLGFQPVGGFVLLKITVESLRAGNGREEQTRESDSEPAHVGHNSANHGDSSW